MSWFKKKCECKPVDEEAIYRKWRDEELREEHEDSIRYGDKVVLLDTFYKGLVGEVVDRDDTRPYDFIVKINEEVKTRTRASGLRKASREEKLPTRRLEDD